MKETRVVTDFGVHWLNEDGVFHRSAGPARIFTTGSCYWYKAGKLHRSGRAAIMYGYGSGNNEQWMQKGVLHRDDGPAVIFDDKLKWYRRGKLHRDHGPSSISDDGTCVWSHVGADHRSNGPAIVYGNGGYCWYKNGVLHRTNGPARVLVNPDGTIHSTTWAINGEEFDKMHYFAKQGLV